MSRGMGIAPWLCTSWIFHTDKPECQVDKEEMDGKDYVVCRADGNPTEYGFKWSLKSDNDTIEQVASIVDGKSYLALDDSVTSPRTYVCVANNSIGQSNSCERHIPGKCLRVSPSLISRILKRTPGLSSSFQLTWLR